MKNLAPTCPDCGQVCSHELTRAVACDACGGDGASGRDDGEPCECQGTGKVSPPPPTDEQIFGKPCGLCCRQGSVSGPGQHPWDVGRCPACGGSAWEIKPAENRWTCLGGDRKGTVCQCLRFIGTPTKEEKSICSVCRNCPGRTDVQAPPKLWAEVKRSWRTRTKTTVVEGQLNILAVVGSPNRGDRLNLLPDGLFTERTLDLGDGCGTWTIVVTFEPDKDE